MGQPLRLLSLVEGYTVTGPIKPLLMFSRTAREGFGPIGSLSHCLLTTRRKHRVSGKDLLEEAARLAGVKFVTARERIVADPAVLRSYLRCIKGYAPQIVETHDAKSHFILFLLRASSRDVRRIPWIAFHHGYTRASLRVRLYQHLDRLTLRYATQVVTLCKPFAADLACCGVPTQIINVLANAVEPSAYQEPRQRMAARSELGISAAECVLLTVGRLSEEKGHSDLLDAFRIVCESTNDLALRLVIAGEGPERQRLMQLARPLGDRVTFLGHVSDPGPLYAAADVFVLPSHSEGSPLVLFEAMAAGLPIVATAVGGVPEVVTDRETALLVGAHNSRQLGERLLELTSDSAYRKSLGSAGRSALQNHSPENYTSKLLAIYQKAIATKGAEV